MTVIEKLEAMQAAGLQVSFHANLTFKNPEWYASCTGSVNDLTIRATENCKGFETCVEKLYAKFFKHAPPQMTQPILEQTQVIPQVF